MEKEKNNRVNFPRCVLITITYNQSSCSDCFSLKALVMQETTEPLSHALHCYSGSDNNNNNNEYGGTMNENGPKKESGDTTAARTHR